MECGLNPPVLVQGPLFGCCEHINLQVLHKAGNMNSWVITRFLRMTLHHLVKDTRTHTLNNVYKYPVLNRHTHTLHYNMLSFTLTYSLHSRNSWKMPTICHEKQFYIVSSSALLKDAVNNYSYTATVK